MENKVIKVYEEQLLIAINTYLRNKGVLQNGEGIKYFCANKAAIEIRLELSELDNNLLKNYLDCSTNSRPCLYGYIDLELKPDTCDSFSKDRYYFHICINDYEALPTEPHDIIVHNLSFLMKQGSRLY